MSSTSHYPMSFAGPISQGDYTETGTAKLRTCPKNVTALYQALTVG